MSATQQKEKVRIAFKDSDIDEKEIKALTAPDDKLWKTSDGNKDFENVFLEEFSKIAPSFCYKLHEEINKPENKDKSVSVTFKDFMYGVRNQAGYNFLWRKKNSFGGSGGGQKTVYPLSEVFCGTADECNEKLKDITKNWYLAGQQVLVSPEDNHTVLGFFFLKRNKTPT